MGKDEWGDPHKVKKGRCKACNGRGIVGNPDGRMQVCPLCFGSGIGKEEELRKKTKWIWRTPNESNTQS